MVVMATSNTNFKNGVVPTKSIISRLCLTIATENWYNKKDTDLLSCGEIFKLSNLHIH